MQRRDILLGGAMAGVALLSERAFGQAAGKVLQWADQPASVPPQLESVVRGLMSSSRSPTIIGHRSTRRHGNWMFRGTLAIR
jgi:hypothetical protein